MTRLSPKSPWTAGGGATDDQALFTVTRCGVALALVIALAVPARADGQPDGALVARPRDGDAGVSFGAAATRRLPVIPTGQLSLRAGIGVGVQYVEPLLFSFAAMDGGHRGFDLAFTAGIGGLGFDTVAGVIVQPLAGATTAWSGGILQVIVDTAALGVFSTTEGLEAGSGWASLVMRLRWRIPLRFAGGAALIRRQGFFFFHRGATTLRVLIGSAPVTTLGGGVPLLVFEVNDWFDLRLYATAWVRVRGGTSGGDLHAGCGFHW